MSVPTQFYFLTKPSLQDRLRLVFPELSDGKFTVETKSLKAKAGSFNKATYITVHRDGKLPIECVEKSITKLPGLRTAECIVHDEFDIMLNKTRIFQQPETFGRIETPLSVVFFTRFVRDEGLKLRRVTGEIARGIAEIEHLSHDQIMTHPQKSGFKYLDFFQPWFRFRLRYHAGRALSRLDRLAHSHPEALPLAKRLRSFIPVIGEFQKQLRTAPRCLAHLDYFRKNLMREAGNLYLIDWGEARIGRIGFDAGSSLHAMLRILKPEQFEGDKEEFLKQYFEALDPQFRNNVTIMAITYLFTLRSFGYFLRPRIIRQATEQHSLDRLLRQLNCVADGLEKSALHMTNTQYFSHL